MENTFEGKLSIKEFMVLEALGCDCCSLEECDGRILSQRLASLLTLSRVLTFEDTVIEVLTNFQKIYTRLQHSLVFTVRFVFTYFSSFPLISGK